MKKLKHFIHEEKGSSLVLVSISLVVLLAFVGLVVDFGKVYVIKTDLQKVANAAALSGAQELTNNEANVMEVVDTILNEHGQQNNLETTEINMEQDVTVFLSENVSLSFSKILGFTNIDVPVRAKAEIKAMGSAIGVAPLGIDESIPLQYDLEYQLKVDQTGVDTGNFGILALGGTGAKTYETNLRNGYDQEIKIGDILDTQTGNIAGKTRSAVNERIDDCQYIPGDEIPRDCSRIILVPVYRPYNQTSNQLKEVEVVGFAYFYLLEPMSHRDTAITGMFIKRTGTGSTSEGVSNKGAYAIRLTD
ncbi:pilus assembly protein TadG-related protein [Chengkuizengella sediminis]|uniref:pilus assembly protein TadG-related protein n=1 Tax=Chengkuizengella sediminis TaxID=1885917 RepID=UPI001389864C|nr:Tad domain-containing protein [Chengkuizengella sediminis]NDI36374.1 hypothetical protein [Chengkuizengella sediminis]